MAGTELALSYAISNKAELDSLDDDFEMHSFQVCEQRGHITGIQFVLRSVKDALVRDALQPIGRVASNCDSLELTGPIERIRVAYSQSSLSITGIEFTRTRLKKTFGLIDPLTAKEWNFDSNSNLMGLYGRYSEETGRITSLGFIVIDKTISEAEC